MSPPPSLLFLLQCCYVHQRYNLNLLLALSTFLDNEIFDLQETTADFLQEAVEWKLTDTYGSATTSICKGTYLVAGYQILKPVSTLKRTYTISQSHKSVFISFDAFMMGEWSPDDQVTIQAKSDSTVVATKSLVTIPYVPFTTTKIIFEKSGKCTNDPDSIFSVQSAYLSSPHTGSSLTLLFQLSTSTYTGTFGIRNVRILLSNTTLSAATQCISVSDMDNSCDCQPGQRKSGGACVDCDLSCETCFDASSSGCYACSSNYYYDGKNCQKCFAGCGTCSAGAETNCLTCQSGYFMYPNASCKASCNSPYTSGTVDGITYCYFPCGQTGQYYFPGGACQSTCNLPFISRTDANGARFCDSPCSSGYYYPSDSNCRPTCDWPFTPANNNGAQFCDSPCSSDYYYFPDGICRPDCDSPFTSNRTNGTNFCNFPCGTTSFYYYYRDHICRPDCAVPYKSFTDAIGANFCSHPCNGSDNYYYDDDNCRSFCDSPFKPITDAYGAQFCHYPCGPTGDYYYSRDSICRPVCDSPYKPSTDATGANFCDYPCDSDQYYFPDGVCRPTCDSPFTQKTDVNGAQFCYYPCNPDEYRYIDGSCLVNHCPSYFEVKNYYNSLEYKYCECVSPNALMEDGSCGDSRIEKLGSVGNTTSVLNSVGLVIAAVAMPGDPGGATTGALTKIIQYSKFLNISYPDKLVMMFKVYNPASGVVSFVPKMSDEQKSKFTYEPLPYNFVAYGVHSCFVVNFWNFMIFLLVSFGVCAGCLVVEKISKEAEVWARKVRAILQNFWIVQLYNSSGDIMLFSIIQFKNNSWDSSEDTLSFLMAILFMLMITIVFVFHLRTSMEYQRIRKTSSETSMKKFEKNYECQQIFFGSFVNSTMNHQLFLFYFALRIMLHNLIIATLVDLPILQTILMTSLSLVLVIYIVAKRPFKYKVDLAQNLTYELIILTVNIALLSFAVLDGNHEEKIGARNNLANLIIVCSVMFTFLSLFFILLKLVIIGLQFYNGYKQKKAISKKGKLDHLERTEIQNDLNLSQQGLQIKQPRELNNLGTRNTIDSSGFQHLDVNNSSNVMENSYSMRMKNQMMNGRKKRILSSEVPLDLSTSLYPLNNNNNSNHNFVSALDLALSQGQNHESRVEREIHAFQQDQISPSLREEISNHPENTMIGNKRALKGIKRRMLNNRDGDVSEMFRNNNHEEISVHFNNDETIGENIMGGNKRTLQGIKRRMLNNRNV